MMILFVVLHFPNYKTVLTGISFSWFEIYCEQSVQMVYVDFLLYLKIVFWIKCMILGWMILVSVQSFLSLTFIITHIKALDKDGCFWNTLLQKKKEMQVHVLEMCLFISVHLLTGSWAKQVCNSWLFHFFPYLRYWWNGNLTMTHSDSKHFFVCQTMCSDDIFCCL